MFRKHTPPTIDRPQAIDQFRRDIDLAVAKAEHAGLGAHLLGEMLENEALTLRVRVAAISPVTDRYSYSAR